ncbi:glycosyltransferase family 90 protein, partial [Paxillus involutus ATCC 200175]
VDSNELSGRFKRLVTGNVLVFNANDIPGLVRFASGVEPWVHCLPIQVSRTDLHNAMAFFPTHDALGAEIAPCREWSQGFWREEDASAYLYR